MLEEGGRESRCSDPMGEGDDGMSLNLGEGDGDDSMSSNLGKYGSSFL